jgi:integrase
LRRGLLTVQGAFAKSGQTATLPLNSKLSGALEHLKKSAKGEYVFTKEDGKPYLPIKNIFRTAAKRGGLNGISPHVCRHSLGFGSATGIRTLVSHWLIKNHTIRILLPHRKSHQLIMPLRRNWRKG